MKTMILKWTMIYPGKRMFFLPVLFLFLLISCSRKNVQQENWIAKVGDRTLTIDEFRRFYEMDPNFGIGITGYPAMREELNKLIDQVLAYKNAQQEGLTTQPVFLAALGWEKRQAMLRQLYREEVESRVEVSEAELRKAFLRDNSEVKIRHLFAADSLQIWQLYRQIRAGVSFDSLAQLIFADSLLSDNGGLLGWFKLGELDEDFADAAESLRKDEISFPVRTRWGYHIIQLLDRKDQKILTESEFYEQKSSLLKRLKRRKGRRLAGNYIVSRIKKINPQPVPETFKIFWKLTDPDNPENPASKSRVMLTNESIDLIIRQLGNNLNKPIIRYKGGKVSLNEYLQAIKQIPVSNRPRLTSPKELSEKMGKWIRDEFLFKEAMERNLDRHPVVKQEVRRFAEEQCYLNRMNSGMEEIKPPPEVLRFFTKRERKILAEFPGLDQYQTLQAWQWRQAEIRLHDELIQDGGDVKINEEKLREESRRVDWSHRIRMFTLRKPE